MATFFDNFRAAFPVVKEAQLNRLKVPSSVDLGNGKTLNADDIRYIVDNTYERGRDGVSYGVGKDGRPYSYTMKGAAVGDVTSLDMQHQRDLIEKFTNGEIVASDDIASPENLVWIFDTAKRMQDYGNGNLRPRNTEVHDYWEGLGEWRSNVAGEYRPVVNWRNGKRSGVYIRDTEDPSGQDHADYYSYETGWHPAYANGAYVTTHELAHAANNESPYVYETIAGKRMQGNSKALKDAAYDYYDRVDDKIWKDPITSRDINDIFEEAARRAGYTDDAEGIKKAMSSISGYAGTRRNEAIAEAYSDVLLNGEKANPFSKELIKLLSERADIASKYSGERSKKAERLMGEAKDPLSLLDNLELPETTMDRFRRNYRLIDR